MNGYVTCGEPGQVLASRFQTWPSPDLSAYRETCLRNIWTQYNSMRKAQMIDFLTRHHILNHSQQAQAHNLNNLDNWRQTNQRSNGHRRTWRSNGILNTTSASIHCYNQLLGSHCYSVNQCLLVQHNSMCMWEANLVKSQKLHWQSTNWIEWAWKS